MKNKSNKNMFKILVVYASQFGSTSGVAEAIGEVLEEEGITVETKWIKDVTELTGYDGVIIGGAIQYDKWMAEAAEFITANQEILSQLPVAYFFTCLTLSKRTEKTERQALAYTDKLVALAPQIKPIDVGRFAGVLNYNKMPIHFRFMFRAISLFTGVQEGDYRDWRAIRAWAKDMATRMTTEQTELFIPAEQLWNQIKNGRFKMKIIIFGATGGTGQHLIKQALEEGHVVTAFVRSPEKLKVLHENLRVVQGDALEYAPVEKAIQGQDAVLCALGIPNIRDKSKLRARATKNIVEAMKNTSVERLICLSSFGAGDSFDMLPFRYKYLIAPLVMRNLFVDHNLQEGYIMESQLQWTIVRPVNMNDDEHTNKYQHGFSSENKKVVYKISRADTADFMLKQLEDDSYLHRAPSLSY